MAQKKTPTIALVYDWATAPYGGAEQVLGSIRNAFPDSVFHTSVFDQTNATWAKAWNPVVTFLQKIPFARSTKTMYAWLMPLAFESLDLSAFDIVISVSSSFAKGVLTSPRQMHVCYLFTPSRFIYSHSDTYKKSFWVTKLPIMSWFYNQFIRYLRSWDQAAALRPDFIIPLSKLCQKRTIDFYGRETLKPLYPPLTPPKSSRSQEWLPSILPNQYFLVVSRMVTYKRIDIAIEACIALQENLVIVGDGPERKNLYDMAKNTSVVRDPGESLNSFFERARKQEAQTYFMGNCTNEELSWLYQHTIALLMPQVEDFGITGLEAAWYKKPVIVSRQSGVAELLEDGRHAVYSMGEGTEDLIKAIGTLRHKKFSPNTLRDLAATYTNTRFETQFRDIVLNLWKEHNAKY